jgi:putative nucleotide binding protein
MGMEELKRIREENAIVLDFLPHGYPFDNRPMHKKDPIIQAIGMTRFTLLELIPRKDVFVQPLDEIYIGEGKRDKVHHISGRLKVSKLTETAKNELEFVIKDLVKKNEKKFIDFFNTARPLSTRMHQIELIPGCGKKHMWQILEKRDEKPFDNFKDIKDRIKLMPDPEKAIIKRILSEIKGEEKYNLFVDSV